MDLIGPLPATKSGHTWIVTCVDRTSKTIVAAAAKEGQMSSEEIEKFFIRQPPMGEKNDYDSENSWISDGLPSSSRRRRRGGGRWEVGEWREK